MKRKVHLFTAFGLNILYAIIYSFVPLKIGAVLDSVTITSDESVNNRSNLRNNIFVLAALSVSLGLLAVVRFVSMQYLQELVAMDMRNDFYKKFIKNDMYFFEKYKSGELVSRLSSDVNQAKSAICNSLSYMINSIIIIVGSLIVLFFISSKLACFILGIVPIYLVVSNYYSNRRRVLVKEYQDVQAEISGEVAEKFAGIQLVKAYSTEDS